MTANPMCRPSRSAQALQGGAIGEVVESNAEGFAKGDLVSSFLGWREAFVAPPATAMLEKLPRNANVPDEAYLGVLGMPGLTGYAGLLEIGKPKPGDTVFVSGAAGAVGSVVSQVAKIKGCTVIASAGTDAKCDWLRAQGIDHAINYKTCGNLLAAVRAAAPKGIDVYFDNVGGEHLEVAIEVARPFARLVECGMISGYNAMEAMPGPRNIIQVVGKSLTIRGFIVSEFAALRPQFLADMTRLDRRRQAEVGRDRVRRRRQGAGCVHRAVFGRQHGEDAGPAVRESLRRRFHQELADWGLGPQPRFVSVMPAKAGIQSHCAELSGSRDWMPAFAGMTPMIDRVQGLRPGRRRLYSCTGTRSSPRGRQVLQHDLQHLDLGPQRRAAAEAQQHEIALLPHRQQRQHRLGVARPALALHGADRFQPQRAAHPARRLRFLAIAVEQQRQPLAAAVKADIGDAHRRILDQRRKRRQVRRRLGEQGQALVFHAVSRRKYARYRRRPPTAFPPAAHSRGRGDRRG